MSKKGLKISISPKLAPLEEEEIIKAEYAILKELASLTRVDQFLFSPRS